VYRALADEDVVEHMFATVEPSEKSWIFTIMESLLSDDFVKVLITLWAIWEARSYS
jgi:hypothetical protein